MMRAAMIGVGKLGYPVAMAWALAHDIVGFDLSPAAYEIMRTRKYPHREERAQEMLERTTFRMVDSYADAVAHADVVFVAVQTPHKPEYEGLNRMPEERADFDYGALVTAVRAVAHEALVQKKRITVVVISTCLPGTCDREVRPLLNEYTGFVYAPMFIAMGTTIADALNPEFVLLGCNDRSSVDLELVRQFFREVHGQLESVTESTGSNVFHNGEWKSPQPSQTKRYKMIPHAVMSVASAELCKVFYNVFLGQKINMANAAMEIAHKVGANIDDVTDALALATDRVVSPKYMRGGMGDGGGCHPRDQIALSWLAERLDLSHDVFGDMIKARERQTEWLADLAENESREGKLPIVILGKAYKKGTNLTLGSPAILLKNILDERPHLQVNQWDPHVDGYERAFRWFVDWTDEWREKPPKMLGAPRIYIIATDHDEFFDMKFNVRTDTEGQSVVIDPWGKMKDQDGVKVIRVGRRS